MQGRMRLMGILLGASLCASANAQKITFVAQPGLGFGAPATFQIQTNGADALSWRGQALGTNWYQPTNQQHPWPGCGGGGGYCIDIATTADLNGAITNLQQKFDDLNQQVQGTFAASPDPSNPPNGQLSLQQQVDALRTQVATLQAQVDALKNGGSSAPPKH